MKQQVKVAAILQQINRSHVASLTGATVARIMSKPDAQIDTWIRTNENLFVRSKTIPDKDLLVSSLKPVVYINRRKSKNQPLQVNGPIRNIVAAV
jgi:hypothetical protein